MAADWQPIETAPKDGTYIMVTNAQADGSWVAHWAPIAVSGYRFEQPWRSCMLNHNHISREGRYLPPTHWQPMPASLGVTPCPPMDSYIVAQQGPQPGIGALTPCGVGGRDAG